MDFKAAWLLCSGMTPVWHDRVSYMRNTMFTPLLHKRDERGNDVANYLLSMFGPDSILPKSPASMPGFKDLQLHFQR